MFGRNGSPNKINLAGTQHVHPFGIKVQTSKGKNPDFREWVHLHKAEQSVISEPNQQANQKCPNINVETLNWYSFTFPSFHCYINQIC